MTAAKPSTRLLDRLRAMGLAIGQDATIRRTYAGAAQRSAGAWVWTIDAGDDWSQVPGNGVGSQVPVTELLRARQLTASWDRTFGEWTIDPSHERDGEQPAELSIIERVG